MEHHVAVAAELAGKGPVCAVAGRKKDPEVHVGPWCHACYLEDVVLTVAGKGRDTFGPEILYILLLLYWVAVEYL